MKRVWGHVLAGVSVLALGSIAFSACVHNDSSIFVQNVLATQEVSNNAGCSFTATPTQPYINSGRLDVDFSLQYNAAYLVGNQLVAEANSQQLMTETSTVTIEGGVVRITDSQGNQLANYTRLSSATIYPATGGVPSYAVVILTAIDAGTIQGLLSPTNPASKILLGRGFVRLVTYVRFFGKTLGGKNIESDEFEFPVDVCKGCLIAFPAQYIDPCVKTPNCANAVTGGTTQQTLPCAPGQDLPIDCLSCQGLSSDTADCLGNYQGGGPPDCGIP